MANEIRYPAKMTREQWRQTYLRAETMNPRNKAEQRWLSALASETHDLAEVTIRLATGRVSAKPFDEERGAEVVERELSRDAVLGIKATAIQVLTGGYGNPPAPPASRLDRMTVLDSIKDVGPAGTLMRLVEKEAVLKDSPDLDEEELDLGPEAPAAAEGAK